MISAMMDEIKGAPNLRIYDSKQGFSEKIVLSYQDLKMRRQERSVDTCEVMVKAGMGVRDMFHAEGRKHVLRLRAKCGHS